MNTTAINAGGQEDVQDDTFFGCTVARRQRTSRRGR
jgi:hypothetical protein